MNHTALTDGTGGNAGSHTSASITPSANKLIVAVFVGSVGGGSVGTTTVAGNGLTWTQRQRRTFTDGATTTGQIAVFTALGASPSAGTVVFTHSANQHGCWTIFELDAVDTTTPVVQSAQNGGTGTAVSVTLSAFADATNNAVILSVGCHFASSAPTITFPTLTALVAQATNFAITKNRSGWQTGQDTSPDATLSTSGNWAAVAMEIATAAGGGGEEHDGGSATTVNVDAAGGGSKAGTGGAAATVNTDAAGAGQKHASGGSTVTVNSDGSGAGTKASSGGAGADVSADAAGGGAKTATSGSATIVGASTAGGGSKTATSGSGATVQVSATGGGENPEVIGGGSNADVTADAAGAGTKHAQGGSAAAVSVDAAGAGTRTGSGGSTATVTVNAAGGGHNPDVLVPPSFIGTPGARLLTTTPGARDLTTTPGARSLVGTPPRRQ